MDHLQGGPVFPNPRVLKKPVTGLLVRTHGSGMKTVRVDTAVRAYSHSPLRNGLKPRVVLMLKMEQAVDI